MDFAQISNLHICEKTRDEVIRNCNKIKGEIGDIPLIICGDIFDKKTYCKGEDIDVLHQLFDIFIDNLIYIIPGESDFLYGSPTNLLDNLKIEKDNVHIITKNKLFRINKKNFLFLVPTDYDGIPDFGNTEKSDYIVLYENDKSKLTNFISPTTEYYLCGGRSEYKQYNISGKKFIYSGSLTKRSGEGIRKYVRWTNGMPYVHNIVIEDELFCYYREDKPLDGESFIKKMEKIDKIKTIYVHFRKCTESYISETKRKIKTLLERFRNIVINYYVVIKPNERIANISDISEDIDFFSLSKQIDIITEKTSGQEIVELHKKYYNKYMIPDESTNKYWQIDKMYWSNLFCYKDENFIDFSDFNGLTTIIGKNGLGKTSLINIITIALYGMYSTNTLLVDNICYTGLDKWNIVLYFSTFTQLQSGVKQNNYIIKRNGDGKKVELSFYEITSDGGNKKTVVNITKYNDEATQKSISEIIGKPDDFLNTNVIPQNSKSYVDRSSEEMTSSILISSYVNKFAEIEEDVKREILNTKTAIRKKKSEIKGACNIIGDSKDDPAKLDKLVSERELLMSELDQIEKKYDEIPKLRGSIDGKNYTEISMFYKSLVASTKYDISKLDTLRDILDRLKPENPEYFIRYAESIILCIDDYNKSLSSLHISPEDVDNIYNKSKTNTSERLEEILNNSRLILQSNGLNILSFKNLKKVDKNSEEFTTYKKYLESNGGFSNMQQYIQEFIKLVGYDKGEVSKFDPAVFTEVGKYDLEISKYSKIGEKLEFNDGCQCCSNNKKILLFDKNKEANIRMFITTCLNCYYTDYVTAQNNIALAEKIKFFKGIPDHIYGKIKEHNARLRQSGIDRAFLKDYIDKITYLTPAESYVLDYIRPIGMEKYNNILNETLNSRDMTKKKVDKLLTEITTTKYNVENRAKVEQYNNELRNLETKLDLFERYLKIVQRDGICKDILDVYLTKLNKSINNILNCITNFTLRIKLEENNLITVSVPEKNINARQCSGGQKFIIDIAIRISLLNITKNRPKFLIIDEGFGSLDMDHLENIQNFMKLIDRLYIEQKNWLLFVSHIDELKDISNNKISINAVNNRSYINNVSPEIMENNKRLILTLGSTKSAFVPSMNDYTFDERENRYYCKYCDHSYAHNKVITHLQTARHKKNYVDAHANK